jgi:hypothetical protein
VRLPHTVFNTSGVVVRVLWRPLHDKWHIAAILRPGECYEFHGAYEGSVRVEAEEWDKSVRIRVEDR